MFARLGEFVSRHFLGVIGFWVVAAALLVWAAPPWQSITNDGDLAYLPPEMLSVQAEDLLEQAFPRHRSKSQIAVIISRDDAPLTENDLQGPAYDIARRLENWFAVSTMVKADQLEQAAEQPASGGEIGDTAGGADDATTAADGVEGSAAKDSKTDGDGPRAGGEVQRLREIALDALDEAIRLDGIWKAHAAENDLPVDDNWPDPLVNRAVLLEQLGRLQDAALDRELLMSVAPQFAADQELLPDEARSLPLLDLWSWRDETLGGKLRSEDGRARLLVLHLSGEFLAIGNIKLVQFVGRQVAAVRETMAAQQINHIDVGVSGSASVGGDLLISAKQSIDHTELFTVILVVLILAVVYRSPVLIAVPLITIFISLKVSTSLVALLTCLDQVPLFASWWHLKVFTTSKIFIVVILFGAGTDFCLFLIARTRESLRAGRSRKESVVDGLSGVGLALAASALTTIAGLAMMVFADFGKYRYSGPVIGLCLAVTLAATLTLTPALIRACGPLIGAGAARRGWSLWRWLANRIVAHPVLVIVATLLAFAPFAAAGLGSSGQVTYDFLSTLDVDSPSRQGAELMRKSFPVGESGPVIVVAHRRQGGLDTRDGGEQIARLNYMLYDVPGVVVVRSLADPLGDTRPGASASFVNRQALEARIARLLDRTAELYLAQSAALAGQVARFELILQHDPFSREAIAALQDVRRYLERLSASSDPFWQGTQFSFTGTTAGIHDLAQVTRSDNRRIERLVVGAVFLVLLIILRRPLICVYLVLSVLLTYYVTIGATELFFSWIQGGSFQGLDWKVPLFLFVILVAVGQDYNVYLVTRVFEEQRQLGPLPGLRTAIERTGGIITSCGVIMVGTFLSMTAGAWSGTLRRVPGFGWIPETHALTGIVQLGFALALGVLLDTFIVRPILVPAFLALLCPRDSRTV